MLTVRPRATITVAMPVLLTGEWHVVELMAAGRNMTMRVDGAASGYHYCSDGCVVDRRVARGGTDGGRQEHDCAC